MQGQTVKIVMSAAVILGAAGFLLADTLADADTLTYYHKVDEVLAAPADFLDKRFRLGGYVEKGSILQRPGTLEFQFKVVAENTMMADGRRMRPVTVRYTGVVPDTFKDDAEVTVTGRFASDGKTFQGQELIAKCPSKYEAAEKNANMY